jgi:hypothetical protein
MRRLFFVTCAAVCAATALSSATKVAAAPILQPNDPILAVDSDTFMTESDYPAAESPFDALDGDVATKYLNFGKYTSGIIITPAAGSTIAKSLVLATANDFPERDPTAYKLWGTNDTILALDNSEGETGENWTLISEGPVDLPTARQTYGTPINFAGNTTMYSSYRLIFPTVRDPNPLPQYPPDSMQISEIGLFPQANGAGTAILGGFDDVKAILLEPRTFSESDYPDAEAPRFALDGLGTAPSESDYPDNEAPPKAIDGIIPPPGTPAPDNNNKYLNFGEENSGFIVTPAAASVLKSFQIATANDAPNRDPATYELYGTNQPIASTDNSFGTGESWTLIQSGAVTLPTGRNTLGPVVDVANTTSYASYKMLFPTIRNAALTNSMQISEVSFYPNAGGTGTDILNAGDFIIAIDATPQPESKYLNFGMENSGFIVTPAKGTTVLTSFQIRTAADAPSRDPAAYALYGTNVAITSADNSTGEAEGNNGVLIGDGTLDLPLARQTDSAVIPVTNSTSYKSYKLLFTSLRDPADPATDSMQIGGVQFFDSSVAADTDFDNDGDTDGADFLAWQRGNGTTTGATNAQGDANGNGAVNGADLSAWKAQFSGGAPVASIPEPAGLALVLAAAAMLPRRPRRPVR